MAAGSRVVDFTDMHRAREKNHRALYTNARFITYLRLVIIVFDLYKKIRATGRGY